MTALALRGISHHFGEGWVLSDVSLKAAPGEFLVIVGPSGCGKSSLLRIAAGLLSPTQGDVILDGVRVNDLEPRERDVAMVFQNYALYPHMTVRGNLAFPLRMARWDRRAIERRVSETAALLGLEAELGRKPATLSGGQMQRVALGRALVRRSRLFLFDEPLSNLDPQLRAEMRDEIKRLQATLGITSLYVTHDQAEAMTMGSRICVLRCGVIQQIGAPLEVFRAPATTFVASFIGSPPMNLLRGRIVAGRFEIGPLSVEDAPPVREQEAWLGIRPHDVEPGGSLTLDVRVVEELGTSTLLRGELAGQPFLLAREGQQATPERRIPIRLPAEKRHWFDEGGVRIGA